MPAVRTGLQRLADGDDAAVRTLSGRRVGLLAHAASVDRRFRWAGSVLAEAGARVQALFGPEHGLDGAAQDMVSVSSGQQDRVPVHSLYGTSEEDLAPRSEWLTGLDAVVIDLQDVGSRYYTYVWTAALMFRGAAAAGVETIVLDRPNPLGGVRVEGGPQREGYCSFVGLYPVAVRHGMTIGELLRMVQDREQLDAKILTVIEMSGWRRALEWESCELSWVSPSPNMPTYDTARVYPGGCLLEGTQLSEGRGTTRPFEQWGAPGLDGQALARQVEVAGALLRPLTFQPVHHKFAGKPCGGVHVHVTDPARFTPYEGYQRLLAAAQAQLGSQFRWRQEPYEFVTDRPAIDLLTGDPRFRVEVDRGGDLEGWWAEDRERAGRFADERSAWLLYR